MQDSSTWPHFNLVTTLSESATMIYVFFRVALLIMSRTYAPIFLSGYRVPCLKPAGERLSCYPLASCVNKRVHNASVNRVLG